MREQSSEYLVERQLELGLLLRASQHHVAREVVHRQVVDEKAQIEHVLYVVDAARREHAVQLSNMNVVVM